MKSTIEKMRPTNRNTNENTSNSGDGRQIPALWVCLVFDLIGCLSFLIPVLGEVTDVVWAPLNAFLLLKFFGEHAQGRMIGAIIAMVEELSPGFDFIPTWTLLWLLQLNPCRRFIGQLHHSH